MTSRTHHLAVSLSAIALATAPAFAQEQAAAPAVQDAQPDAMADAASEEAEEIVVTGSSIRGVAPVGSALIAVGREELDNSAATTTIQVLRETPQVLNYGVSDASRSGTGGASNIVYGNSINLRGIGPYATLTLINGRRAVPQGTIGATIDPSMIPVSALERVEIIADGASAIYGSDAVAGVANLILRRRFEGLEASVQHGFADDYKESQLGLIGGHRWGSGQVTLAFQHSFRSALRGQDRDFYRSDLTPDGGSDYRVTQCAPGNIVVGGVSYAIPAGGATSAGLVPDTVNRCDTIKNNDILPRQEINSATLTFDQDLSESVSLFVDAFAARRDGLRHSAGASQNLTVPDSNAFFVAPAGATLPLCAASARAPAGARCETVQYSFINDYGPNQTSDIVSKTWQVTAGLTADLFSDIALEVYGTAGYNHDHVFSAGGNTNAGALTAALASSDPATAFNPFGTSPNNPAVIASIFNNVTDTDGRTKLRAAEAKLDGSLFELPGGKVRFAVGAEYYQLKLRTGQLRGPVGQQTGTDNRLSRNVKSAYLELLVPIFGPENAIPGFQSLDLNVAGRIDDYSDVGTTKNPKVGINWQPFDDLKLHGSYGESFRAPLLTNLVSAGGTQLYIQNYFDPTANGGAGATIRGVALSGGNLGLKPETARTYSFGFDYTPSAVPGAQLSLNYFDVDYRGQINGYLSNLNVLRQEALFRSIILRDAAAQARIGELVDQGLNVNNGTAAEARTINVFVDGRGANLGRTITRGLDFGVSVPWRTADAGDFRFSLRGTRFFVYKVAITPGGTIIDQLNNIDYPLKLRMRGQVGWSKGGFDAALSANYQNGYRNTLVTPAERIKANTTFDLRMSYDLSETGISGTDGLKIGLDVTNLFDRDPPFVDIAPTNNGGGGFDPQTSSPIGRLIAVSLSKKF